MSVAFAPSSTIYLCSVPFDNSYKNQVYFSNASDQYSYFSHNTKSAFSDYLTVRETLPDGSSRSAIKVNANIDTLRLDGINYVFYCNANHGGRMFFAFVTEMIYINEGTTKLVIETDVYQTWRFDVELLPSFVVREHSKTDVAGENIVPEKFPVQEFTFSNLDKADIFSSYGYLIASSAPRSSDTNKARGLIRSGMYQGLYFYFFEKDSENTYHLKINECINDIESNKTDSILFIALVPKFCIGENVVQGDGYVGPKFSPSSRTLSYTLSDENLHFGGYEPKNNKLFTAPYYQVCVTNNSGDFAYYSLEDFDFSTPFHFEFKLYGDTSGAPSVMIIPRNYKGLVEEPCHCLSLSNFPQASYSTDSFKLWLAKNQGKIGVGMVGSVVTGGLGIAATLMNPFIGGAFAAVTAVGQGANSALSIANQIADISARSHDSNNASLGQSSSNLLSAIEKNDFIIMLRKIKKEQAKIIDEYFTMFGYQTNRVKVPNVSSRPYFNYVQTIDVNIKGGIPSDQMERLKAVYNNGVTLWKSTATIGDYSVDNSP